MSQQIEWNTIVSVGNEEIDAQHQKWVEIFNQLEAAISDSSSSREQQYDHIKYILEFTHKHFEDEEQLMAKHNYPHIVRHRRMHKEFEQQVYEKFRQIMDGELVLHSELIVMIRQWFITHTANEDKRAFDYINENRKPSDTI